MDRRKEPRLRADEPALMTVLDEPGRVFAGRIADMSGRGMRLLVEEPVRPGAAVQVDWADALLLGEVCYCQVAEGGYSIGLNFEQALFDTAELARLAAKLIGEAPTAAVPHPVEP
jgi:hypothetical protein